MVNYQGVKLYSKRDLITLLDLSSVSFEALTKKSEVKGQVLNRKKYYTEQELTKILSICLENVSKNRNE